MPRDLRRHCGRVVSGWRVAQPFGGGRVEDDRVPQVPRCLTQADWGGVTGYFADPEGYPWEVVWSPSFPMDERGLLEMP